ncbi:hypothetical protein ABFS83_07G067100 [Erythranthe nasuta]
MDSGTNVINAQPPVADFSPSMWGDFFSTFSFDNQVQETYAAAIESLKKEVRTVVMAATSGELIKLVDTLERLGLAYHFETEIEEKLEQINNEDDQEYDDLFTTALRFRLLRQHRYRVSCGVFDKYFVEGNKTEETLVTNDDVEGLLSLYEAANVRIHGEDVLEEALAFTKHHLTRMLSQLESRLQHRVKRSLEQSLHRCVPMFDTTLYISIYESVDLRNELILKLAKLNLKFLKNMYKKELSELSRWWNNFNLKEKLPYTRDRMIECYLLGVMIRFEPQYSVIRKWVAKSCQLVTVIDDTYDNYATLEQAQLFTDVLERWDMAEIDRLPNYMKIAYRFIMSMYEDYQVDAATQEKSFAVPYFIEAVKQISRAYNQELKWVMERKMPSFEDYIDNSLSTSCFYVIFSALALGMKSVTKETIDWLLMTNPNIVVTAAKFARHLEDLGSHERENKGGQMLTVVDCYMKEHGVSKQETLCKFAELVEDRWKDVNTECVAETWINKEMVELVLNYVRMSEFVYKNREDGFTDPARSFAPLIVSLFVDPIVLI